MSMTQTRLAKSVAKASAALGVMTQSPIVPEPNEIDVTIEFDCGSKTCA
jgi:hypothetical protein